LHVVSCDSYVEKLDILLLTCYWRYPVLLSPWLLHLLYSNASLAFSYEKKPDADGIPWPLTLSILLVDHRLFFSNQKYNPNNYRYTSETYQPFQSTFHLQECSHRYLPQV